MEQALVSMPNHQVNPVTGFLESPGYSYAFDSDKKLDFLRLYKANGLSLYKSAALMGVKVETINKAIKIDPVFKKAVDDAEAEYIDALESKSRDIALTNDKATLERIFQLKALRPSKYGGNVKEGTTNAITFNITGDLVMDLKRRGTTVDTTISDGDSASSDDAPAQFHYQSANPPTVAHSSREERTDGEGGEGGEGARP